MRNEKGQFVKSVIENVKAMNLFVVLLDNGMSRLFESHGQLITDKCVKYRAYRISRDVSRTTSVHTSVESINVYNV